MSEKVAVAGLRGKAWSAAKVKDLFVVFGPITEVILPKEGNALITYKFSEDAVEAVFNMNGAEVEGGFIRVEIARAVKEDELRVTSKHAVWGSAKPVSLQQGAEGE